MRWQFWKRRKSSLMPDPPWWIRWYFLHRIKQAAADRHALYMERCWIENDEDGFTGWRWDKYNRTRYIVCAANRYKDYVTIGSRHFSVDMAVHQDVIGPGLLRIYSGGKEEQGFIDQYGTFYNRADALALATANNQVRYPDGNTTRELFSEGLY